MRRAASFISAAAAVLAFGTAAPASASHEPYCGIRWGSLAKVDTEMSAAEMVNVRAGRHACFDRLVLDFRGDIEGYRVSYVPSVREDGSGRLVPLRGAADLQIIATAPAHTPQGKPTYQLTNRRELVNVSGWNTFRQVAWAGSFEGQATVGLGVRARLPFRTFTLDGPGASSRLVIDVAHRW
jgi:hypothetical protein